MAVSISSTTFDQDPALLMAAMTELDAIERWSPVPFRIVGRRPLRLRSGDQVTVEGAIAGGGARFTVDVECAEAAELSLRAHGPIDIDVTYVIDPNEGCVTVRVETRGRGLLAWLILMPTKALLQSGVLDRTLLRLVSETRERGEPGRSQLAGASV
jgi:hypothetical protein